MEQKREGAVDVNACQRSYFNSDKTRYDFLSARNIGLMHCSIKRRLTGVAVHTVTTSHMFVAVIVTGKLRILNGFTCGEVNLHEKLQPSASLFLLFTYRGR